MKKTAKVILWVVGIVAALLLVVSLAAGPIAKNYVNRHGEQLTGRRISVGNVGVNLFTGHVYLRDLSLYEDDGQTAFAGFDTLDVRVHLLQLPFRTVNVRHLTLSGLYANVLQDGDRFNFSSLIDHFASDNKDDKDTTSSPWTLKFYNLHLLHASLDYRNLRTDRAMSLPDINLRVPGFVLGGEEASEGGLHIAFAEGGNLSIDGNYDSRQGNYYLTAKLADFALQNLQPLTSDLLTVDRLGGTLQVGLKAEGTIESIMKSHIGGSLTLNDFSLEQEDAAPVAQLRHLEVQLNNIDLDANSFDIRSISAEGLSAQYEQWSDHTTLDDLLAPSTPADTTAPTPKADKTSTPMKLHVGQVDIRDCNLTYANHTLPDEFRFPVTNISLRASDLTLGGDNNAQLRASLPGGGHLAVRWQGNLDNWKQHQDLFLTIKGLDLKQLSPWAVAYTGQPIEDGVFGLTSRNTITASQLSGQNILDIYNPTVGKRRKDVETAKNIPLKTALYVLKDKDNKIELEVPVKGNIDSPEFNYMKLVWKTLGNLLVKVATSPARALGNALGLNGTDLEFIPIDPSQLGLSSEQYHILGQLATIAQSDSLIVLNLEQRMPAPDNDSAAFRYTLWNNLIQRYMQEQGVGEDQLHIVSGEPTKKKERTGYAVSSEMKIEE